MTLHILNEWVDEPMPLLPLDHAHVFEPWGIAAEGPMKYRCKLCGRLAVDLPDEGKDEEQLEQERKQVGCVLGLFQTLGNLLTRKPGQ